MTQATFILSEIHWILWSPVTDQPMVAVPLTATEAVEKHLSEDFRNLFLRHIPLKKIGLPEEIAAAVVYFSSDEENMVWTRIVLLDLHGKLLGESGILLPGQAITDIALKEQPAETMDITVKVLSYEPETYYSHGSAEILGTLIV